MKKNELISFFSEFWQIDKKLINDSLILDSENLKDFSSIRVYQFFAAIESNFNVKFKDIENIKTFKDLYENISK